jgi:hypothetical protein
VSGKAAAFVLAALLVAGLWLALGRNGGKVGVRTRFREWSPSK